MILAIIGSRDFNDRKLFLSTLIIHYSKEGKWTFDEIVSGGANGADKLAEIFSEVSGVPIKIFLPDWKTYGKSAGYRRNVKIIDYSNEVLAFRVNNSKGTGHSIKLAEDSGKPVRVINL